MEAIPSFKLFFFFVIHRLGNIKVLSKLDPGRLIHWEIAGVGTFSAISMTVSQWISFCVDGRHMFTSRATASHWMMTFVVYDERLFTKGRLD